MALQIQQVIHMWHATTILAYKYDEDIGYKSGLHNIKETLNRNNWALLQGKQSNINNDVRVFYKQLVSAGT